MSFLRRARHRLADLFDRVREPGWPRRIAILVILGLLMLIPYPLSITGEFEVISRRPIAARNRIDGVVTEVSVHMGDEVKQGQVIARLLDAELLLQKKQVAAQLAEVEASLRLATKGFRDEEKRAARARVEAMAAEATHKGANLARATALYRAKDLAKARFDEARNEAVQARKQYEQARQELRKLEVGFRDEEIAQATAKVEQLKVQLATTEQHLAWTEIRAPIAGVVVTPDHELQKALGTLLPRGTAVLELVAQEDLVARVMIPESEFGDVELGMPVELRSFQYPSTTFEGQVDSIEPRVERVTEYATAVPLITRVTDPDWNLLRVHAKGRAKVSLGLEPLGYVLYRRVLRSAFVKLWSWY